MARDELTTQPGQAGLGNEAILDGLKHISLTHRAQFQERRNVVEWRCFFSTLTFYALTVAAAYGNDFEFGEIARSVLTVACVLVAYVSVRFLGHLNMAANKDKELAENAEDGIRDLISGRPCRDQSVAFVRYWVSWGTFRRGRAWGWLWQAVTLAGGAIATVVLVLAK